MDVPLKRKSDLREPKRNGRAKRISGYQRRLNVTAPIAADARQILAVVGNGMVSQRFCERCVELGLHRTHRIVVFGEEALPAYDRVRLTSVLAGRDTASLILKPMLWYADHDIDLRITERVVEFDRAMHTLTTQLGEVQQYDQLVFATGSVPAIPDIPGARQPGVFAYRTAEDVKLIRERGRMLARGGGRVVVIGSGLLGVEAGQALKALGCAVTFIEAGRHMLRRQLDAATASIVADMLLQNGFDLCIGQTVEAIVPLSQLSRPRLAALGNHVRQKPDDLRLRVELGETGLCRSIECGMVILASGVTPRDEIAKAGGIVCPEPGGIEVNAELCTNDPSVFAIGECARYSGRCYGLIAPGYAMAEVLAERLAGKDTTFSSMQLNTRLEIGGQEIVVMGESADARDTAQAGNLEALVSRRATGTYRRLVLRDGRLVGAASIGPWLELPRLKEAISSRALLRGDERKRFARGGALWGAPTTVISLARWQESATVCACTGVSYGALCRARAHGAVTVDELCAQTRAASVCGTCRPLLVAFVDGEASLPVPRYHLGFAFIALSALVAIGAALAHAPIALSESVRGGLALDVLWRDPVAKQLTGYTLVGSCALSAAVLTLRKRWRRLSKVDFLKSRTLHAALGLFTLACVGAHTGLRWGRGLDFVLVMSLLAMMVLGAGMSLLVASERLLQSPIGQSLRRSGVRLHLWLAWPIPVLVVFHVVRSYYF